MTYKTNLKTLKNVYRLLDSMGLAAVITGGEVNLDIEKILFEIVEEDAVNTFCNLIVDGEGWVDYEELSLVELESVILGFFDAIKESSKELKLLKMVMAQ